MLFRFAIAFLKKSEDEMLQQRDSLHLNKYLRRIGESMTNVKRISWVCADLPVANTVNFNSHYFYYVNVSNACITENRSVLCIILIQMVYKIKMVHQFNMVIFHAIRWLCIQQFTKGNYGHTVYKRNLCSCHFELSKLTFICSMHLTGSTHFQWDLLPTEDNNIWRISR